MPPRLSFVCALRGADLLDALAAFQGRPPQALGCWAIRAWSNPAVWGMA